MAHFVDWGGGTGHLALAFLDRYPGARATVFDLPQVVPLTREITGGRVATLAGDFFADPLPEADRDAVARILHDWSEPRLHVLLVDLRSAARGRAAADLRDAGERGVDGADAGVDAIVEYADVHGGGRSARRRSTTRCAKRRASGHARAVLRRERPLMCSL